MGKTAGVGLIPGPEGAQYGFGWRNWAALLCLLGRFWACALLMLVITGGYLKGYAGRGCAFWDRNGKHWKGIRELIMRCLRCLAVRAALILFGFIAEAAFGGDLFRSSRQGGRCRALAFLLAAITLCFGVSSGRCVDVFRWIAISSDGSPWAGVMYLQLFPGDQYSDGGYRVRRSQILGCTVTTPYGTSSTISPAYFNGDQPEFAAYP